jgi:hypothetical protein
MTTNTPPVETLRTDACYERAHNIVEKHQREDLRDGAELDEVDKECRTLERELAQWKACAEGLADALESAPEPICSADSERGYEKPHIVINFSAVDSWWILTRSKALNIYNTIKK